MQYAVDENKIVFDKLSNKYKWPDGRDIVFVDVRALDDKIRFLAQYFSIPSKKSEWQGFVRGLLSEELLERQDKRGLYWLAEQMGLEEKKRTIEELREELKSEIVTI